MATRGAAQVRELPGSPRVERARPQRGGVGSRLSAGHLVMIVAGILAFVATAGVLQSRGATVPVAVAAHEIVAGSTIDRGAVRSVTLPQKSALAGALLRPSAIDGHQVAVRLIHAGEPLTQGDVQVGVAGGLRAMAVPVAREHAAGGDLAVGDRVDVIAASATGASYVVRDAQVLALPAKGGSGGLTGLSSSTSYYVTVAVGGDDALRLAAAVEAGKIEVVRSNGAPAPSHSSYSGGPAGS